MNLIPFPPVTVNPVTHFPLCKDETLCAGFSTGLCPACVELSAPHSPFHSVFPKPVTVYLLNAWEGFKYVEKLIVSNKKQGRTPLPHICVLFTHKMYCSRI